MAAIERRVFRNAGGLPWACGGTSATRKAAERALTAAEDAGLVTATAAVGKRTHVRLTAAGEARARAIVGLPGFAEAAAMLARCREALEAGQFATIRGERWIPETLLANCEYGHPDMKELAMQVEDRLLPLLVAGTVASNTSHYGWCWYMLTDTATAPPTVTSDAKESATARRHYFATLRDEVERIKNEPLKENTVSIALPAHVGIGDVL